ncbi:TPA: TraK family protein [Legionella pneumophila]
MTKSTSTKSLSARIAERAASKKTSISAQNRAAFLVIREDVRQALNDGWSSKTIWETLLEEEKISCSYPTFNSYVTKLIPPPVTPKTSQEPETQKIMHALEVPVVAKETRESKVPDAPQKPKQENTHQSLLQGLPGFISNAAPNKETVI